MPDGVTELIDRLKAERARNAALPPDRRRQIREDAQVSYRELGVALGDVSYMTIRAWEKGGRPKGPSTQAAYDRYFTLLGQLDEILKEPNHA